MDECDMCSGRIDPPGDVILEEADWIVDHCVGPLPVGTLIVKPRRHCVAVADLTDAESAALGPLLKQTAACVRALAAADQVYVCLWSHAGWRPGHIHFVVQPAWNGDSARFLNPGPTVQAALFAEGAFLDRAQAALFAERARAWMAARP